MTNLRVISAEFCQKVIREKISLTALMDNIVDFGLSAQDRGLVQEITYGTIRFFNRINSIVNHFLSKKIDKKHDIVVFFLATATYQILYTRIPDYATINETIKGLKEKKESNYSGLANAVLRNVCLNKDMLNEFLKKETEVFSHPQWIIKTIKQDYPKKYKEILSANNIPPPFWIRVNLLKTSLNEYIDLLNENGIQIKQTDNVSAICLTEHCDVSKLPMFNEGYCYIQDLAAQRASIKLNPKPKERILDACAAPGGKTTHIIELSKGEAEVVALDIKTKRLHKLQENLKRNNCSIVVLKGSASKPDEWWDGKQFDKILIDAPCSGLGVIRRHPDIKFIRNEENIRELVATQREILDSLWPLLKIGGTLLYSTCSILKCENTTQVNDFIYRHKDQAIIENPLEDIIQTLPGDNDQDGFFYAKIVKKA